MIISTHKIKQIATEKYKYSSGGITFEDLTTRFRIKRPQAQRSLKHFHAKSVLFTAEDLILQGIDLLENKSPQQYFPTCIKADIIEGLKKRRNVEFNPWGSTSQRITLAALLRFETAASFRVHL